MRGESRGSRTRRNCATFVLAAAMALTAAPVGSAQELSAGIERIEIRVGELVFDVLAAGPVDGEPVLLLHGFPQTSYSFRHQLVALAAAGFRAVAPDQRGYSPHARPESVEDYSMGRLVGDVAGMATSLGYESFHLVGHDWGAAVAWVAAANLPQRVRSLTVLSTPHPVAFGAAAADEGSDQAQRSAYMSEFRKPNSEQLFLADDAAVLREILAGTGSARDIDVYVSALGSPAALGAALNWYRAMVLPAPLASSSSPSSAASSSAASFSSTSGARPTGSIPLEIKVPTLYVFGEEDPAFSREAAEASAQYVSGPYRFEALTGVGHWLAEQATDTVNALLLDHLSRNSRRR